MRGAIGSSFLASALIQGVNVGTGVLLARSLGTVGRGELAALLLWPMLITSVGMLGGSEAVTYFAASERARIADLVVACRRLWLVQSAACTLLTAAAALVLVGRWDEPYFYVPLASALVPLYLATGYAVALLQGMKAFTLFNTIRAVLPLATALLLAVSAAVDHLRVWTALVAYLLAYLAVGAVAIAFILRRLSPVEAATSRPTRAILAYGVRSHVSFVATTLNERLDQTLIALFLAPAMLGVYVVAGTLTSLTLLVASTVALVALPTIAARPEGPERDREIARLIRGAAAAAAAASSLIFVVVPWLVHLLFGDAFARAASVARILLVAAIFLALSRLFASILRGINQPLRAGLGDGAGVVVTLVALPVLLPTFGLTGAAVASLLGYAGSAIWMYRQVRRSLSGHVAILTPSADEIAVLREYVRGRVFAGRAEA